MFIFFFVSVIIKNDVIKDFSESSVGIVRSSIYTNSRINVLTSRKNHLLEANSSFIFLTLEFIESISCNVFGNKRFGSCWPDWYSSNLLWFHQMWSAFNICSWSSSGCWSSSSSTKCFLSSNHGFNSIVHVLDQVNFTSTKSSSVRNIENTIISFGMLSVNTSDLNIILISDFVELLFVLFFGKHWEFNMNGSSQSSSKISWA